MDKTVPWINISLENPRIPYPSQYFITTFSVLYHFRDASYLPDNEGVRPFALDKLLNNKRPAAFHHRPRRFSTVRAHRGPGNNSQILPKYAKSIVFNLESCFKMAKAWMKSLVRF